MNPLTTPQKTASLRLARYLAALRWVALAALVALVLTPLVIDRGAHDDAFFTPKWAWIAAWTALGVAAVAARALAGKVITFPFSEIWGGALLLALWHWVAVLWARSPSLAAGRAMQITWLTLALWLGLQVNLRRRALLILAWSWVGVATLTALWVLLEDAVQAFLPGHRWVVSNLGDWRGWLVAGLGNTSHLGDLLALALLPTLVLLGEARGRLALALLFAAALLLPAALIVSFSVGSNFGLIAGAALLAGLVLWRTRGRWFARRARRWLALAAAWAVLILFFILPHPANPHGTITSPSGQKTPAPWGIFSEAFGSSRWQEGGPTRLAIWAEGLEMLRLHPLLGVGTGNFTYVFPEMDSRLLWNRPELRLYQGLYTNAAHNELLQTWAELGIVGLFLFLSLIGLAFHSLLRGIQWADTQSFLIRATLAGLLLAWLVQAQMNFSFQHPAGALTFYTLLFAVALEKKTRSRASSFPSLSLDYGLLVVRVDVQSMTKPTAVGLMFRLPGPLAIGLGVALLAGVLAWGLVVRTRPVRAQREYRLGAEAEKKLDRAAADAHFRQALALDPNAQDVRSHYSDWLIRTGHPQEGLAQLKIVRRRLNSNELWEREARGLAALGLRDQALQAQETFTRRIWRARLATGR